MNDLANQVEHEHVCDAATPNAHLDVRARRAAQAFDEFFEGLARRIAAVDGYDEVAAANAGSFGRRSLDGGQDDEMVVPVLHFDADAPERALGVALEGLELVGRHVARVRIELRDHSRDGAVHELGPIDGVDVFVLHLDEHATELLHGRVRGIAAGQARPSGQAAEPRRAGPARKRRDNASRKNDRLRVAASRHHSHPGPSAPRSTRPPCVQDAQLDPRRKAADNRSAHVKASAAVPRTFHAAHLKEVPLGHE